MLGAGVLTLAVWSARQGAVEHPSPLVDDVVSDVDRAGHGSVAVSARSRRTAEFFAVRKEQQIQRLLTDIQKQFLTRDKLKQSEYYVQQVDALADEDVPLVLQRLDDELRRSEFGVLLLRRWTGINPAAAVQWVQQLPDDAEKNTLLAQAATVWSGADLNAAVSWVRQLPEGDAQQGALQAVAREVSRQEPFTALELANKLPPGTERDGLILRAIDEWAAREPVEALRWTAKITDPAWQQQVRASLVPVIAGIDGAAGAELTAKWLPPGPEQQKVALAVILRWAQESPEAAAEWVNRFPAGTMRLAALDNLKRLRLVQGPVVEESSELP